MERGMGDFRTTKQSAVARFRKERMDARAPDAKSRQDAFLDVVSQVNDITMAAQDDLAKVAADRASMSKQLHGELDRERNELTDAIKQHLNLLTSNRAEFSKDMHYLLDREVARLASDNKEFISKQREWLKSQSNDRAAWSKEMNSFLDAFAKKLADEVNSVLQQTSAARKADRDKDFADRRAEVDEMRFGDFTQSA